MKICSLAINTVLMSDSRPVEGGTSKGAYAPRVIVAFVFGKTADLFLGAHESQVFIGICFGCAFGRWLSVSKSKPFSI